MAEDKVIESQQAAQEVKPVEKKVDDETKPIKDAEPMVTEEEVVVAKEDPLPITDLIAKGTKAFWLRSYTEAVAIFGEVSERLVKQHGDELNDELGNVYLYYGKSLLELAREQGDPFGDAVPAEVAVGVAGDEEGEGDDSNDDDDEDEDDDEEEGGDEAKAEEGDAKPESVAEKKAADSAAGDADKKNEAVKDGGKPAEAAESDKKTECKVDEKAGCQSQGSEISVNGESIVDSQSSTTGIGSQTSSSASQSETTTSSSSESVTKALETTADSSTMDSACAALRCTDKLETSEDSEEDDEDDDGDDLEEGEIRPPKDADPSDLQVAWEVLELAKQIFLKREDKGKEDYADCLVTLAEVSMEGENFDGATADLRTALDVLNELNAEQTLTRKLAHTHYTLGMVMCGSNRPEESIVCYETTLRLLQAHLAHLQAIASPGPSDEREIAEVQGLIPEIEEKISDLKSFIEESRKSDAAAAAAAGSEETKPTTSADKAVTNISHLVKRKRDDGADGQGDCPAKKPAPSV